MLRLSPRKSATEIASADAQLYRNKIIHIDRHAPTGEPHQNSAVLDKARYAVVVCTAIVPISASTITETFRASASPIVPFCTSAYGESACVEVVDIRQQRLFVLRVARRDNFNGPALRSAAKKLYRARRIFVFHHHAGCLVADLERKRDLRCRLAGIWCEAEMRSGERLALEPQRGDIAILAAAFATRAICASKPSVSLRSQRSIRLRTPKHWRRSANDQAQREHRQCARCCHSRARH